MQITGVLRDAAIIGEFLKRVNVLGRLSQACKEGGHLGRHVGFLRFKRRKHEQGFRSDTGINTALMM